MKYFAFQICDNHHGAEIWVDSDPESMIQRLMKCLNSMRETNDRIEMIEVGTVNGQNHQDAIDKVRMDKWTACGYAEGVETP